MSDIRSLLNAEQGCPQNLSLALPVTCKRPGTNPESWDLTRKRLCVSPTECTPCPAAPGTAAQRSAHFASPATPAYQDSSIASQPSPLQSTNEEAEAAKHPAAPQAPSAAPPFSPVALRESNSDRFARSRTVGQTHRDKERNQSIHMDAEVHQLAQDHGLLYSILGANTPEEEEGEETVAFAERVRAILSREMCSGNSRVRALNSRSAAIIGISCLSGSLASLLLEFIAARRNLIAVYGDERRRRPSFLVPPAQSIFTRALSDGRASLIAEAETVGEDKKDWLEWCLACFSEIHDNWALYEENNDQGDVEDHIQKPEELKVEGAVEKTGRGKGPKRCSRCNKFKYAGSGHGRSKCDDHQLISSSIPYRGKPH